MISFKVNTEELQEMVGKAICCSSNNKILPITSLMSLKVSNNIFTLTTTDAANYFYVSYKEKVDCGDFEVSVIAELFTKLIQKTSTKDITLTISDNVLEIKGNGTHKIELPLDENCKAIRFPKRLPDIEPESATTILKAVVNKVITYNKPSLAVSSERPVLKSYYCGTSVLSSDREKVCKTDVDFFGKPALILLSTMELLNVMSDENINVAYVDDNIVFWTLTDTLVVPVIFDAEISVDQYPADALFELLELEIPSKCKVAHTAVMDMLDRLSLFVSSYDKREITLTFSPDGILFSSKQSNSVELVPYIESENFEAFTCGIDIEVLKAQISAQTSEAITMYYGHDDFIKMVCDNVTQLVALADEEEVNG